jgi:SWI/SNF-related matrix-associated actin-dependent regulator of chromatin subfamily B protein 1
MPDPVVTPEHFAQTVVEDYNLPASYHNVITKSIQDQLSDFRAHSGQYDGDSGDMASPILANLGLGGGGEDTLKKGTLKGGDERWWAEWRKRLIIIEDGAVKKTGKGRKRRKVFDGGNDGADGDEEDAGDGCDDDNMSMNRERSEVVDEVDQRAMHEDMRILIKVFFVWCPRARNEAE